MRTRVERRRWHWECSEDVDAEVTDCLGQTGSNQDSRRGGLGKTEGWITSSVWACTHSSGLLSWENEGKGQRDGQVGRNMG